MKDKLEKAKAKINQVWEENPSLIVLIAMGATGTAMSVVKTVNETRMTNTWKKEVERRSKLTN